MNTLDSALALAKEGFWVFPVLENAKKPPLVSFTEKSSRDPKQLREWFEGRNHNIGIFTGRYANDKALLVPDVDNKPGKDGDADILKLEITDGNFPETRETLTPTGGRHLFYIVDAPTSQQRLADSVDVRSHNGYVLGPGSRLSNGEYKFANSLPIAQAPDWLVLRQGTPAERKQDSLAPSKSVEGADTRAIRYLQSEAPLAVEGKAGDNTTYRVACRLKDFGCAESAAFLLMADNWNARCSPPWTDDDLRAKVHNAYAYSNEAFACADPRSQFDAIPDAPAAAMPGQSEPASEEAVSEEAVTEEAGAVFRFELFSEIKPDLARADLVDDLLDLGGMSILYGDSNTGKSFNALDIAFHIAAGRPWMGREVESGVAAYIAAEGGGHFRKRIAAIRKHYELGERAIPLALIPSAVDLAGEGRDVDPLIATIRSAEKQTGGKCKFVVVDTLSRAMGGTDENASKDMTAFVRNVDRIRKALDAHVMVVHHTGKDKAKGARGHSSLRAATDTELEVANDAIAVTKQRDRESDPPIGFALHPVEIGQDKRGKTVKSCVVLPRNIRAVSEFEKKLPKAGSVAARALQILQNLTLAPEGQKRSAAVEKWEELFCAGYSKNKSGAKAFTRARQNLVASGVVLVTEGQACVND